MITRKQPPGTSNDTARGSVGIMCEFGCVRTQSGTFQTIPTKHTFAVILKLVGRSV